jgi:mRNA interferase RelE/StbE
MKAEFKASFAKDLRGIKDNALLARIKEAIEQVEQVTDLQQLSHLKKLKGDANYYRLRVGEYRLGITIDGDTVTFVRCLNGKEIYRYFP